MRDPARIDVLLQTLRSVWVQEPDLRLGQLLIIAAKPKEPSPYLFYIEDEALLDGLIQYREQLGKTGSVP
jgi:uncharacterized protein YihD (DUF1040 family)